MDLNEALDGAAAGGLVLAGDGRVLRGWATIAIAAVMLPISYPVDQHLPDLNVRDRHFFYCVHL